VKNIKNNFFNSINLLTSNSLSNNSNIAELFKITFLNYIYRNAFTQILDRTRNHELGLILCEKFEYFLNIFKDTLTAAEYETIDSYIITLRLNCLDKTDRWNKYIEYFDDVLNNKRYLNNYAKSLDYNGERFGRFLVGENNKYYEVHFLYAGSFRYEIIQRKINRSLISNKLGNLKHHSQDRLTDEEIEKRINQILSMVENIEKMNH
jgi:hypothetical protein